MNKEDKIYYYNGIAYKRINVTSSADCRGCAFFHDPDVNCSDLMKSGILDSCIYENGKPNITIYQKARFFESVSLTII